MKFTYAVVEVWDCDEGVGEFTQRYVCESKQHMEDLFKALELHKDPKHPVSERYMEVTAINTHLRTSSIWTGILLPFRALTELT